ncbi:hypothetical protein [Flavobacterium sp.]|uniref:hypothetical protein n=1 Tax=Flavobacterium sp. TaxID=239 RepID=UPI0026305C3A|nr:hypothetical protein [Flavobacterium sp.]
MEFLSAILELFYVLDSKGVLNKNWKIFIDSDSYIGTRFIAFISVLILIVFYLGILVVIVFLIYSYFAKKEV